MVRGKLLFFISLYASRFIVFYENSVDGTEPSMKIDVSFIGAFGELKYENFHYLCFCTNTQVFKKIGDSMQCVIPGTNCAE